MTAAGKALLAVGAACAAACAGAVGLTPSDADVVLARHTLDAPDPAEPGPFAVRSLYYGSGTDRRRPEYRDSVAFRTETVDASKLVDLGNQADERNGYWGFTPEAFPLNGRVWYPEGPGPFPLALIVHGNHDMRDFSDPGYGYLGELLASRGIIMTSVDMNFVNGGIREENDARGWLLLKHLEAWRGFNGEDGNPFRGRVDMSRIALLGHSRGGEAVANAAAFNRLRFYPDDATLAFDFGFDIQSIVSIAPVDGQYLPTGRKVPVRDVNYLTFHGSHDGDVTAFHGLRLYDRVEFTDDVPRFKSAIYVYRANHGQWNTVWNSHDNGPRSGRILDLDALIDPEAQRRFGKLYISAFLEITLKGDDRYLPMFRDHRAIGDWLPKTMYITRYRSSAFRPLATFEEDIDVTTGTAVGVTLAGDSLATWREATVPLRSRNRANTSASQENQAVWLGWNNRIAGPDTTARGAPARFTVSLPASLASEWGVGGETTLDLVLAPTRRTPGPRRAARDSVSGPDEGRGAGRGARRRGDDEDPPPIDLSVEVTDAAGQTASVPLSRYGAIRRPLDISVLRRKDQERDRFSTLYELVMQSYSIPLRDFTERNARLDVAALAALRLVFDRAVAGEVVVDEIGMTFGR